MREIPGDLAQLALGHRSEGGVNALVEFLQGQPALCVMLAQAGGRCLAVGVPNPQVGSCRHLILRVPPVQMADSKTIYRDALGGNSQMRVHISR